MLEALGGIYFYNANGLATELKEGTISEHRAVKHLVALTILSGIGFTVPLSVEFVDKMPKTFEYAAYIGLSAIIKAIFFFGIWQTYKINNKGDGKDFILRLMILSLPIGIKLVVLFLKIGLLLLIAIIIMIALKTGAMPIIFFLLIGTFIVTIVFFLMFFSRMRQYISVAAGLDRESDTTTSGA